MRQDAASPPACKRIYHFSAARTIKFNIGLLFDLLQPIGARPACRQTGICSCLFYRLRRFTRASILRA